MCLYAWIKVSLRLFHLRRTGSGSLWRISGVYSWTPALNHGSFHLSISLTCAPCPLSFQIRGTWSEVLMVNWRDREESKVSFPQEASLTTCLVAEGENPMGVGMEEPGKDKKLERKNISGHKASTALHLGVSGGSTVHAYKHIKVFFSQHSGVFNDSKPFLHWPAIGSTFTSINP